MVVSEQFSYPLSTNFAVAKLHSYDAVESSRWNLRKFQTVIVSIAFRYYKFSPLTVIVYLSALHAVVTHKFGLTLLIRR